MNHETERMKRVNIAGFTRRQTEQMEKADWSRSTAHIARSLCMSYGKVYRYRIATGKPKPSESIRGLTPHQVALLESTDWMKTNSQIAKATAGVSAARVGRYRIDHNKPQPLMPSARMAALESQERLRAEWESWAWQKRDASLAREHGLSRERIRQIRLEIGQPKNRKWLPTELVNWEMPPTLLARIWKRSYSYFKSNIRKGNAPKRKCRFALKDLVNEALLKDILIEIRKSQIWNAGKDPKQTQIIIC